MLSKLQQKKIEHLFKVLDTDENKLLEAADFSRIAAQLAKVRNVAVKSPRYEELHAAQMAWWERIHQAADKNSDGQVTLEEWNSFWTDWLTMIDNEVGTSQSPALEAIKHSASVTFDIIDTNGSGQITAIEYADWCQAMSLNFDVYANFRLLDVSQRKWMNRDEIIHLVKEYFLTNDPEAPGNYLYGPLV